MNMNYNHHYEENLFSVEQGNSSQNNQPNSRGSIVHQTNEINTGKVVKNVNSTRHSTESNESNGEG